MFGFAASTYYEKTNLSLFLALTFATRFLQGFSSSAIQTTVFSATGQLFAENQAKAIAWMEIACGFGLAISPTAGKFMYESSLGYKGPFILIGTCFLIFAMVSKCVIPAQMDARMGQSVDEEELEEMPREERTGSVHDLREQYQSEAE